MLRSFNDQKPLLRKSKEEFICERLEKELSQWRPAYANHMAVGELMASKIETMERELKKYQPSN